MSFAKKSRSLKRGISLMLAGALMATSVASASSGAADNTTGERDLSEYQRILDEGVEANAGIMAGASRTDLYQFYIGEHKGENGEWLVDLPDEEIKIDLSKFDKVHNDEELDEPPEYIVDDYDGEDDCLIWGNDLGRFEYTFDVKKSGLYNLEFLYETLDFEDAKRIFDWGDDITSSGKNNAIEIGVLLKDSEGEMKYPFSSTRGIELDKHWQNDGVIETLRGHQQPPLQIQNNEWITYKVKDKEGMYNEPYFFYLEEGENTIMIEGIKVNGVALKSMTFKNYPDLTPYAEVKPSQDEINNTPALNPTNNADLKNDIGSNTILLQAETPYWRSSLELGPTSDRETYLVSPSHHTQTRYNTMGGNESWSKAGQATTWEFTVPEDGYYRFSAKVKQNTLRGFRSNRRILINGEVPVKEFNTQTFPYSTKWYQKSFTDENGEDIYIHLNAGKNYITLEAVPGEIGETMQRISQYVSTLNYYYRRILMVVGPNPDEYNDYRVDDQIPELIEEFKNIRDALREEKKIVERFSKGGSEASTLETMAVILDRCISNPDRIPLRTSSLRDNIGSLSAWVNEASRQPIVLDYIEVATSRENFGSSDSNFFKQMGFLWNGFIGSFFEDYTKLDGETTEGSLNVWVGLGRDQALVLKNLLGDYNKNNEHARSISLNLVQGGILEATLAGKGPDVALFIGGDFPIQLAARDLTVDVSKFDDYEQIVSERFVESLPTFFTYLDGVYGLPMTQAFPMMFYRTDILEDLGLEPPETWDEFIEAIAVLGRAYLKVGLVPPLNTANLASTIFEPGETFTMLQLQTGLGFYRQDENGVHYETTFNEEESIAAFKKLTDFYTVYQVDQSFDAFTRFRTGEMPILIMPYPFFNQVNAAAPEIRGLWDFQHVPGTLREDENGEEFLDISASSGASCGLIFSKLDDEGQSAAWDFLKWLTSDDVQTLFGQNMEAMLGPLGRFDTANKNAFSNLAWTERQLRRLEEQRAALVEIPMIPANYAATRHIKNAFRSVVNENSIPRFALNSYNNDINAEIRRKNSELKSHGLG